jgi:hypothetical protein
MNRDNEESLRFFVSLGMTPKDNCPIVQGPGCQLGKFKTEIRIALEYQPFLTKPSYNYLTILCDHGHCPLAVRAGEWAAVVRFRWLQRDTFATAQADYS